MRAVLLVLAALAWFAAPARADEPTPAARTTDLAPAARTTDKVQVGVANSLSDVTLFIADAQGLFAREGIAADFVPFSSATQMVAPLGTGDLDVGAGGPSAGLYNAASRQVSMKIVADKGSMPPGYGYFMMLVNKKLVESGKVRSFADFKGLRVGDSSKEGSGDVTLAAALRKGGLKFGDVDPYYMSFPQLAAALQNGALDAALITEPSASAAIAAGSAVLFAPGDVMYPNQQLAVLFYSQRMVQDRPEVAQRFMNAYVRAARIYNDALRGGHLVGPGSDAIVKLLIARTSLKNSALYRTMIPQGINPDGCANTAGLHNDFEFYAGMGWVTAKVDPDSLVDDRFCRQSAKLLGPYKHQ